MRSNLRKGTFEIFVSGKNSRFASRCTANLTRAFSLHARYIVQYSIIPQVRSEGPDQTAHSRSLIWAFAVRICHEGTFFSWRAQSQDELDKFPEVLILSWLVIKKKKKKKYTAVVHTSYFLFFSSILSIVKCGQKSTR